MAATGIIIGSRWQERASPVLLLTVDCQELPAEGFPGAGKQRHGPADPDVRARLPGQRDSPDVVFWKTDNLCRWAGRPP